jgi:hypothetical protein
MRTLRIITAVLLFNISLFSLLLSIAGFTVKDIGAVFGIVFLFLTVILVLLGIRLIKKPAVKEPQVIEQTEYIPEKMTFLERLSYSFEYFSGQIRNQNERNQKRKRLGNE